VTFFLRAGILAFVLISPAVKAADFPVAPAYPALKPVFGWNGPYVGVNLGVHTGQYTLSSTTTPGPIILPGNALAIDAATPRSVQPQGVMGGIQAGYNWQSGNVVYGLEGDINGLGGSWQRRLVNPLGNFITNSVKSVGLATARARLGWVRNRALLYVTGGYAGGVIDATDTFGAVGGTLVVSSNPRSQVSGWTVGAGIEYALLNAWSVKLEYLYVDLGTFNTSLVFGPPDVITFHHRYTDNIVRAGLNYRFGW
jgi:outer membrane immunogenic protein